MPKLTIDEREIEVPEGTKIIEAAERLGIVIPRFCYHPALGSVGACRVCAVKCLQGDFKGVQMSCMLDAQEGMVVSTTDPEAVEFRRYVIEWLMLHHPHDCPVCDEGGHCLLQDMTIAGGHGLRRYEGPKRTYRDQDLGPLVQHEMNRCIHCYRCSRYYQEFAGYRDLGAMQIANRTYFGRFAPGVLESPFAGNLSDICPTGVYTDKPSRYKGRRWDYQRRPAVCINCALGCHIVVSSRLREVVRQEAHFNPIVNGHFICDRGRFGFYYAEAPDRPRRARVDKQHAAPSVGLREAAAKLEVLAKEMGPEAVAGLGGLRSSLETMGALHRLCRERGWKGPAFFPTVAAGRRAAAAVRSLAPDLAVSLRGIEQADAVLVLGADPVNEAPMLALALRQAWRRGAAVAVIDPRPISLPLTFTHIPLPPEELGPALAHLCRESVAAEAAQTQGSEAEAFFRALERFETPFQETLDGVAAGLRDSRRPVIVCGTDIVTDGLPALAADAARLLKTADKSSGLFYVLRGAGAFGAALLGGPTVEDVVADIEAEKVGALLVVESDPFDVFPDRRRLEGALERLELLVVLDYLDSAVARRAHVLLPASTVYETGGHFANQEGRLQRTPAVYSGGRSILQTGGGSHPPRSYTAAIPESGPRPAWQMLTTMEGRIDAADAGDPLAHLARIVPGLAPLEAEEVAEAGDQRRLATRAPSHPFDRRRLQKPSSPDGLQWVLTDWTFGTEALSVRSPCLEGVTPAPFACLHSEELTALGLADGQTAVITTDRGELTVTLRADDRTARGVLVLPRHHRLDWQVFPSDGGAIRRSRVAAANTGEGKHKE